MIITLSLLSYFIIALEPVGAAPKQVSAKEVRDARNTVKYILDQFSSDNELVKVALNQSEINSVKIKSA